MSVILSTTTGKSVEIRPSKIIAFVSMNFTMEPGDIIVTGTPSGVGPLKHGDQVEVEIENIGTLVNPVQSESA